MKDKCSKYSCESSNHMVLQAIRESQKLPFSNQKEINCNAQFAMNAILSIFATTIVSRTCVNIPRGFTLKSTQ